LVLMISPPPPFRYHCQDKSASIIRGGYSYHFEVNSQSLDKGGIIFEEWCVLCAQYLTRFHPLIAYHLVWSFVLHPPDVPRERAAARHAGGVRADAEGRARVCRRPRHRASAAVTTSALLPPP
jgi:hypothetical protein